MSLSSREKRDKKREERLRQERLAYVGTLAAGLVHDLRDPLHVIQLNVQMLAEEIGDLPPKNRARYEKVSNRIYQEVQALSKTLEMFLTFVRPPRLEAEPVDLNYFLRERLEFLQPEFAAANVELRFELAKDMYPVSLDQSQFSHVILNLTRNAREAILQRREDEGRDFRGEVTVRTRENVREELPISIEIIDNGRGIKPGDEEKIFDLFYTTKEKGTGLGLNIVRRIVEEHHGIICAAAAHSDLLEYPVGAAFIIKLPRGYLLAQN